MTREKAIQFIGQSVKANVDMAKIAEAIEAISALQLGPCEDMGRYDPYTDSFVHDDCISRQAVLTLAKEECETAIIPYKRFVKGINALPPVQPKAKTGHWIWEFKVDEDNNVEYSGWVCDCCHNFPDDRSDWDDPDDVPTHHHCPNCGSKMESEDRK